MNRYGLLRCGLHQQRAMIVGSSAVLRWIRNTADARATKSPPGEFYGANISLQTQHQEDLHVQTV
jgi:hypothetical protein